MRAARALGVKTRALVTNPRILIFDEATSALDYESERIVQDNMRAICKGRTVLIVGQQLSTVRHADRILMVEEGRIAEDGSHEELVDSLQRAAALEQELRKAEERQRALSAPVAGVVQQFASTPWAA